MVAVQERGERGLADLRVRLEGALDEVESARADLLALREALPAWDEELPSRAAQARAVVAREPVLEEALGHCAAHAQLAPLVREVRALRDEVRDLARAEVRRVAPHASDWTLSGCVGRLLALATAPLPGTTPPRPPLAQVTTTTPVPWPVMVVAAASVLVLWFSLAAGAVGIALSLMASSAFRRITTWAVYEDGLLVSLEGQRAFAVPLDGEVSISPAPPSGWVQVDALRRVDLPPQAHRLAQHLALLSAPLLRRPAGRPTSGALVAGAALRGPPRSPGAALLVEGGVAFVGTAAGRDAWRAISGAAAALPLEPALLLQHLSRLDGAALAERLPRLGGVAGCAWWPRAEVVRLDGAAGAVQLGRGEEALELDAADLQPDQPEAWWRVTPVAVR